MIFGRALIPLCPACRERIEHHDMTTGMKAHGHAGLVADEQTEFVEQPPRQHAARSQDDLCLVSPVVHS